MRQDKILSIQKAAFLDELNKLAGDSLSSDSPVYGETHGDPVDSQAYNRQGNGSKGYYYRSKDEISQRDKGKPVTRSPYESFSEDDTFGYKEKTAAIRKKLVSLIKGRKYPSPEMAAEYDAANDNASPTEFSTGAPNQYPRDHTGLIR